MNLGCCGALRHLLRPALHHALRHGCGMLLLLVAVNASAARIGDQTFDERLRLAETELMLNGVGLRSVVWLKGFAAGLYLTAKASAPDKVLTLPGPKRLQMKMILDVETKEFIKAFNVSLQRNNTEAERTSMRDRIEQFNRNMALVGKVKKGDVVNLDFIPGKGLILSVNGTPRGKPVEGADLYASLLKVFIGEQPVDKKLKAGLLGEAPA